MSNEISLVTLFQVQNVLMSIKDVGNTIKYLKSLPQLNIPVDHIFAGDIYIRQITIPKDSFLVGKLHRYKTADIMLTGKMLLYNGFGEVPSEIEAPLIFETPARKRKIGYALEETVWMNCFPTTITDIKELEKQLYINEGDLECLQQ